MPHQTPPSLVTTSFPVIPYPSTDYDYRYGQQQNIDDIVYRYSAESNRGTPKVGLYSQDGLWDEDDRSCSDAATTIRPDSGSTFGASKSKSERSSVKGRSRSGTMASGVKTESGMWGSWGRKQSMAAPLTEKNSNTTIEVSLQSPTVPPKGLEKKKSKSVLRGKGRRGELSVNISPSGGDDEPLDTPPRLPPTPASFMTGSSPALSTASMLSPPTYPTRPQLTPEIQQAPPAEKLSAKSSWRRGMQKLFKSKSSVALREAFKEVDTNRPAMPEMMPRPHYNPLGKPFSSTPPMPSMKAQRDTTWSIYSNSPLSPPSALGVALGSSSHPHLPADPFASSLDMSSNRVPASISASPAVPPKPRLSRNSPSLRDLKAFLAPAKPRLTKAKSMANIRQQTVPASAPPEKVQFTPVEAKFPKRVKSVIFPPTVERRAASEEPKPVIRPRPTLSRIATDSPPLLPPRPSYFPSPASYQLPISAPGSPLSQPPSVESPASATGPPPSTPLPALPASAPLSPIGTAPIKRSGSGAVLLPRSRSTSMSLKAPPTSSSFFDLYEQLGIWPTPSEKDSSTEASPEVSSTELQPAAKIESKQVISKSSSTTFSVSSWEAAISAFPVIDDLSLPAGSPSMDFGQPHMMDQEMATMAPLSTMLDEDDEADASFTSLVAVGGSTCSASTSYASSQRTSTAQAYSSSRAQQTSRSHVNNGYSGSHHGGSRHAGGSHDGSGSPSRDETRPSGDGAWFDGASAGSSGDSSDDEDDKPLSALHPEAAAMQKRDAIKRKASKRAAKVRAKGRNPGGESGWDGEGGIPAATLSQRLEKMAINPQVRVFNWQLAQSLATSSSMRQRTQPNPTGDLRHARSVIDPSRDASGSTAHRSRTSTRSERRTPTLPSLPTIPSPVSATFSQTHSPTLASYGQMPERHISSRRPEVYGQPMSARSTSDPSRQGSSSASSSSHHHHSVQPMSAGVTRSNTAATSRSSTGTRSRALSNVGAQKADEIPRARATTEPVPQRVQQAVKANAFVGGFHGTRIYLDLYPETTARDVLSGSSQRGELSELGQGMDWVVVESFAELGYERQVREYEPLQAIVKGWDPTCRFNCFIIRQSNSAITTWTRAIPTTAPFVGGYVQYETKKGKWSKRFLETRGGQVFVSKNDKNKEEFQINTLFHDVFHSTRSYTAPKPFVFVMKRVEPASSFENPSDYIHIFSAEDSIGWKLAAAIFDAKSHAISQTRPQLLATALQPVQRRPTVKVETAPLIDLKQEAAKERQMEKSKSGFTGKGLLRI